MLILTCSSKLQVLEGVLRKALPKTLPVCGAVMHINRGNPAQHEVVVDSWPEFKAVLTRPRKEVVKDNRDYYANLHAAFYQEEDACRALLENRDAVDWDKAFQLQGLQDGLYQAAKVMAQARHVHLEPYFYQATFHPEPAMLCQNQLRSDPLQLGTLSPSHAVLVNDVWPTGGNDRSLRYIRSLIDDFPNACLLDEEGQPVAWCLSDAIGCMTHSYAIPKYRGKGHMKTVFQALARKLHAKDFALYGGVLPENQNSKHLLISQGFHFLPWTKYVLFITPNHTK
ncbi:glycine N-acyltransferase-like protein 3 isoform 2-T2 [Liasis olivaceus]